MSRVRLEVSEDRPVEGDVNAEELWTFTVEVEGPATGSALSRATRAMKEALAEPQRRRIINLENLRFDPVGQETLNGVSEPNEVQVERCPVWCPIDEAGHPPDQCARLLGHSGPHQSDTAECEWSDPPCESPNPSSARLFCDLPWGHAGPHQKHFNQGGTEWA